jgi:hypothetical protein
MERSKGLSRGRRQEITHQARAVYAVGRARGLTVDQIQDELRLRFQGELAPGEARMHAQGWHAALVREGVQSLASEEGADLSGLQDADVLRWLRNEVFPRDSLDRLCRLFQCHQVKLGWPAIGDDVPLDYSPQANASQQAAIDDMVPALVSGLHADSSPSYLFSRAQLLTTKLLDALLIALAFPKPLRQTDFRVYCHRAARSFLVPIAWAGAHREGDVHDTIPYGKH